MGKQSAPPTAGSARPTRGRIAAALAVALPTWTACVLAVVAIRRRESRT